MDTLAFSSCRTTVEIDQRRRSVATTTLTRLGDTGYEGDEDRQCSHRKHLIEALRTSVHFTEQSGKHTDSAM